MFFKCDYIYFMMLDNEESLSVSVVDVKCVNKIS